MEKSYQVTQLLSTSRGNGVFTGKSLPPQQQQQQQQPGFSKHSWIDLPLSREHQNMTMVWQNENFMNGTTKAEVYRLQPTTSHDYSSVAPPQSSLEIIHVAAQPQHLSEISQYTNDFDKREESFQDTQDRPTAGPSFNAVDQYQTDFQYEIQYPSECHDTTQNLAVATDNHTNAGFFPGKH